MTNQALTNKTNTGLAVWGERGDVRELDTRLQQMLPGADKLNQSQRLALAQGSLAHGLDPFNGEIWMIPGRGLMIGVKGLRKKAREQVKGNFWCEFVELTDADYRVRQRIPEKALAYECRLFDSENLRTYAETCERLLKAGIPWDAVSQMVGSKPYTVGIGVLAAGEQTKMQPAQCAMKRAEADAIKRRFDVPFGLSVEPDNDAPENGEWIENTPAPQDARTEEQQAHQAAGIAALYGDDELDALQAKQDARIDAYQGAAPTSADAQLDNMIEEAEAAPVPAPVATVTAAPRASSTASMKIRTPANQKTWQAGCKALALKFPDYQTKLKGGDVSGLPDYYHILGAAKKCLFDTVTDDNFEAVITAIEARAGEAVAA